MKRYALSDADYFDLWKYFQAQAELLKANMFQSVTWIIGFAAAVLGFILAEFVDFEGSGIAVVNRVVAILFCVVGLVLCLYALFLLSEFAGHINRNWERSDRCLKRVDRLQIIINPHSIRNPRSKKAETPRNRDKWGEIWHKIGFVVSLFIIAFFVLAIVCATSPLVESK